MRKFVLAALLLCGTAAYADTLTFTGATANGENGPYTMILNSNPATQMICFSDANFISGGESWNVQAYNITQIASLSGPFAGTTTQYNELGYLADQLFAQPGSSDLQQAIWFVLGLGGGTANADYTGAVNFVSSNPGYMTSDIFYIPVGPNLPTVNGAIPQPFIGQVPEPSSLALLVAGMLGLFALSLKKSSA
jgi:hypothetical protein